MKDEFQTSSCNLFYKTLFIVDGQFPIGNNRIRRMDGSICCIFHSSKSSSKLKPSSRRVLYVYPGKRKQFHKVDLIPSRFALLFQPRWVDLMSSFFNSTLSCFIINLNWLIPILKIVTFLFELWTKKKIMFTHFQ